MSDPTDGAQFRYLATLFRSEIHQGYGVDLELDEAGVRWTDQYIERLRANGYGKEPGGLVNTLGAFLGEAVIATYGGEWKYHVDTGQWGVHVDVARNLWCFPIAKVAKQFANGSSDSILSFFTVLPALIDPTRNRDD